MTENHVSSSRAYALIAPCLLAIIVDGMGFGLVYPIMTAIFADPTSALSANASPAWRHFYLSLGYMLYPLCMFFGASFMGDLSDNLGRKKVILICMIGIFVSFLLMAFGVVFSSIALLMIGRALSGLMAGSQPIAQAAIVDISTPETKAYNMSIITLALSFANVAGPLVGGLFSDANLSSHFTFATPFYMAAVAALLATIWIYVGFHETSKDYHPHRINLFRPIEIFVQAFQHKSVRMLAIIFLLMQLGFSIYFQFILVLLHDKFHYQNWELGAFNAFIGFAFALSLIFGMKIMLNFWKLHTVAVISLCAVGIAQFIAAFVAVAWQQWALAVPIGGFDMIAYTAILTAFSDAVDKSMQGWVMGLSGAIMAFSWAVTGFSANLLPILGATGLIALGGILLIASSGLMYVFASLDVGA